MNIAAGYTLSSIDTLKRVGPGFRVPGMVFWVASDLRGVPSAYQFVATAPAVNDPVAVVLPNEGEGYWRKLDRHVLDELDDVSLSTLASGQSLYYNGESWINRRNEAGYRRTLAVECPELRLFESFTRTIPESRAYLLLRVQASAGLWVRVYRSLALLEADLRTEPGGPLPTPGTGPSAEVYGPEGLDILLNPIATVAAAADSQTLVKIVRIGGSPGGETLNLGILALEQTIDL